MPIKLKSHSKVMFPIIFKSRISKPVRGRISFTSSKSDGNFAAGAMVFDLVSSISGRTPQEVKKFSARLYKK